ncbi:MAG: helix-hairpin-helix domain-containing protein [Acidobacteria bacterium]|nr:helix-hairpin-helix domain-containing protein [Acidobacteriota bacterium]MBK9529016.1 helix-hairpin-helix domain-containing protein [Acidobacteriota bacterium]MBP7474569.1 helix-hairpin-helix domain-containing protein [Pyrinomonadaceae bacterium]MBP9109585.1 helix-hairpin-helix domain-containing protein [Pyrinomonadaceae bacterium]
MRVNFILIAILIAAASACSACSERFEYDRVVAIDPSPNSININIASADELEKLPGIGRKTADTIISFRNENGPFRRVEHLMLIRGISEDRFIELRPHIRAE